MKSSFKRLFPSLIVALSFAASQASYGMIDDNQDPISAPTISSNQHQDVDFDKIPEYIKSAAREWLLQVNEEKPLGNSTNIFKSDDLSEKKDDNQKKTEVCKKWLPSEEEGDERLKKAYEMWRNIIRTDYEKNEGTLKQNLIRKYYDINTPEKINAFEKIYNGKVGGAPFGLDRN
jgi:hypothetical protein